MNENLKDTLWHPTPRRLRLFSIERLSAKRWKLPQNYPSKFRRSVINNISYVSLKQRDIHFCMQHIASVHA